VTVTITVELADVSVELVVAAGSVVVIESLTLVEELVVVAIVVAFSPLSSSVTETETTPSTY
jgi:hypothetical protein